MLSDPLQITDGTTTYDLPRGAARENKPHVKAKVSGSTYRTAEGDAVLYIWHGINRDMTNRHEIALEVNHINHNHPSGRLANRYIVSFETNHLGYNVTEDLDFLRAAMDNLLTESLIQRILGGES